MFLESCILSYSLAFLNPADPSGTSIYPSGIKDDGDYIYSAPPAATYPLLELCAPIKLFNGTTLPEGIYSVKPSTDEKNLFLTQGHDNILAIPIVENIIIKDYKAIPCINMKTENGKVIFTYQIENILKKAIIKTKQSY